ncbi:DNA mismatch repair protein msh7 [Datura stramonium]|uniref:DNA mismatch repair protein msh7 n=1 Tax=Datura stramonium TaxID=4076 RepID=A0ABS8Y426_DATST|nr:DNA mismatch repair protein msh7 [Datura stramonium]
MVKVFGLLVKGLRIGLDLLRLLQKECLTPSLAKVVSLPVLDGDNGLDKFLTQFEATIDSDFPNFQVLTVELAVLIVWKEADVEQLWET